MSPLGQANTLKVSELRRWEALAIYFINLSKNTNRSSTNQSSLFPVIFLGGIGGTYTPGQFLTRWSLTVKKSLYLQDPSNGPSSSWPLTV